MAAGRYTAQAVTWRYMAQVEPTFYVPIVPSLLLNGAAGIGTGWSTKVPCYHPLEVVEAVEAQ